MYLYDYDLRVKGRVRAETRAEADALVRRGITFTVEMHDSIDEMVVNTSAEIEKLQSLQRRKSDDPR